MDIDRGKYVGLIISWGMYKIMRISQIKIAQEEQRMRNYDGHDALGSIPS